MTIEELLVYGKHYIHSDQAKILLGEIIKKNPLELFNCLNQEVKKENEKIYKKGIKALKEGQPLQYVIGKINFYGNTFVVNEKVLIPRFETEELIENTILYIKKYWNRPIDLIDLGCGSGVIGITLEKKVPTASVDLVDISKDALEVTKKNIELLNSNANIIESDFFDKVNKKYDVIISNPPYIKTNEEIETIVKNNEPHIALYAGKDGLDCYQKILKNIKTHMNNRCLIAFEIGQSQKDDISKIVHENLENVRIEVKKDLSGRDRMLFIFKNLE